MSAKIVRRDEFQGTGPVRYKIQSGPHGVQHAFLTIDYADAPVPAHYYVADYYEVANLDPRILITFGKLNHPRNDTLRNKLEIDFPAMTFVTQFWKSREDFQKLLRTFVEMFKYKPIPPGKIDSQIEKVQTLHSNNAMMVLSGGECMIDFFYLSPRDMTLKTAKSENLSLEPLVRVIVSPDLLLGFLDACQPIADELAPKYSQLIEEEYATLES